MFLISSVFFLSISSPCPLYPCWSDRRKRTFKNVILLETNKDKNRLFLLEAKEYSEHRVYL